MLKSDPTFEQLLAAFGLSVDDLATHSIRKGSATFVLCGSTGGPSAVVVARRMGWKLFAVDEIFLKYEDAGDYFVGRAVCGLPLDSPLFAILPPHFPVIDEQIMNAAQQGFPQIWEMHNMREVLYRCIASLAFHEEWIKGNISPTHLGRSHYLFRTPNLLSELRAKVSCSVPRCESEMPSSSSPARCIRVTGIPPYITILRQQAETAAAVKNVPSQLEDVLRERAEASASVSKEYIDEK